MKKATTKATSSFSFFKLFQLSKKSIFSKTIKDEGLDTEKVFLLYNNKVRSFFHDVPLSITDTNNELYNFIVEIPNQSRIIREMNKLEPFNPLMRKVNKVNPNSGNIVNTRDYSKDPEMNYGFLPQTFSSKSKIYLNNLSGDNDPLDVIDISGPFNASPGEIRPVNILGSFCLIDQGEMDWKIIVSNTQKSISPKDQEKINSIMEWFKMFKTFFGKKPNIILQNNKFFNKEDTIKIIKECHEDYKSSPYYIEYMNKNCLHGTAINYHFTRKCNYSCKFCFHTKKTSFMLPIPKQIELLRILKDAGAEKINFAGGEPFLFPEELGELVKASKEMGFDSVSIISNGKLIKESWLDKYGKWLDILGVSCDTADPNINFNHGRITAGSYKPIDEKKNFLKIAKMCKDRNILFKVNTVVTSLNKHEDMSNIINELNPIRWKIFQVLDMQGENYFDNQPEKNMIKDLLITEEDFNKYLDRNRKGLVNKEVLVPESNELMRSSYLLVDEFGRFLDTSTGGKLPTRGILEIGLVEALNELNSSSGKGFDKDSFYKRGGYYPENWNKERI
jgi:radical S-adenosyl methionine domain-containing protein 2